jgi:hypothetical protein
MRVENGNKFSAWRLEVLAPRLLKYNLKGETKKVYFSV